MSLRSLLAKSCVLVVFLMSLAVVAQETDEPEDAVEPESVAGLETSNAVWIDENSGVTDLEGNRVPLASGEYTVTLGEFPELMLTPAGEGEAVTVLGEQVADAPGTQPGSAYLTEEDDQPAIYFVTESGDALRMQIEVADVQTRAPYVLPRPDLRISMSGPFTHYSPVTSTFRVRVYSDNRDVSNVRFDFFLCNARGFYLSSCFELVSARGARCNIAEEAPYSDVWDKAYRMKCLVSSIARNSYADVTLRMKWVVAPPQDGWGSRWTFRPSVDRERAVRESNEYNNWDSLSFTIHRKTDLKPTLLETTLVRGRSHARQIKVTNLGSYSVRNVKVVLSLPGFSIGSARPTSTAAGFSCSFSNSTAKVTCIGGRMGGSVNEAEFRVSVRPKSSTPDLTPVILQVDPDRRISESSDTNNTVTKNWRLCNVGSSSGYCY